METAVDIVLHAGRAALDVALYTLLPIMVVLLIIMRVLEVYGVLGRIVRWFAPLARPFGPTGLGVLAMIQTSFISFIAPLPTLALMEDQGASDRQLAAALAAILAMAPANATFPLVRLGLDLATVLPLSLIGGLTAAATAYWILGRRLSNTPVEPLAVERQIAARPSLLKVINLGGAEAVQIVLGIIPMLLLSLVVVTGLQRAGAIDAITVALTPLLDVVGVDQAYILPALTKYLAGGTALVGVFTDKANHIPASVIARGAGFLLHPLDLPGLAILISAGPRLASVWLPAVGGACVGIVLRGLGSALLGLPG